MNLRDLWGLCSASDSQAAGGKKDQTATETSNPDVNRTSKKGVDVNLFPKDQDIYKYAKKIDNPLDDNVFVVGGHGAPSFMEDDSKQPISARKLSELIKADDNYQDGMSILLVSCSTGKKDEGFAQKLADEMGLNTEVIAPTKTLWISSKGSLEVYDIVITEDEKGNKVQTKEPGEWKTFTGRE
ncbi:MAG: hypothetical protein KBT02_09440 [Treponema sp.]|nr:hypothetical protein [Candidatus Treponema caballi]